MRGKRRVGSGGNGSRAGPASVPFPLPLLEKESTHPCFSCALCCTYMALEIDNPSTNTEYDYLVWYLYHEGVSVFVDWEGDWYLKFESRCTHLTPNGMCGVYEDRPAICRDFSFLECERNNPEEPPDKWLFETADAFLDWFGRQRPKASERFQAFLAKKKREKTPRELRRVKISELAGASALSR